VSRTLVWGSYSSDRTKTSRRIKTSTKPHRLDGGPGCLLLHGSPCETTKSTVKTLRLKRGGAWTGERARELHQDGGRRGHFTSPTHCFVQKVDESKKGRILRVVYITGALGNDQPENDQRNAWRKWKQEKTNHLKSKDHTGGGKGITLSIRCANKGVDEKPLRGGSPRSHPRTPNL